MNHDIIALQFCNLNEIINDSKYLKHSVIFVCIEFVQFVPCERKHKLCKENRF